MFLFLQVLCMWWPGPWRWVKKESVLVLTDPILTPSWTQLEVVGWSYSMLEPPVLASLTLSPQAAAFSGHSGEYIIQGERKWGCRGWICIQIQRGLPPGYLQAPCPSLQHGSRRYTRWSVAHNWCDPTGVEVITTHTYSLGLTVWVLTGQLTFLLLLSPVLRVIQKYTFKIIIQEGFSLRWWHKKILNLPLPTDRLNIHKGMKKFPLGKKHKNWWNHSFTLGKGEEKLIKVGRKG